MLHFVSASCHVIFKPQHSPIPLFISLSPLSDLTPPFPHFVLPPLHSEFVIDFACALPGLPKPDVCSRIILTPEHAKLLLGALQGNIYKYEYEFGKIMLPNQEPGTIAPFGKGKGQA